LHDRDATRGGRIDFRPPAVDAEVARLSVAMSSCRYERRLHTNPTRERGSFRTRPRWRVGLVMHWQDARAVDPV